MNKIIASTAEEEVRLADIDSRVANFLLDVPEEPFQEVSLVEIDSFNSIPTDRPFFGPNPPASIIIDAFLPVIRTQANYDNLPMTPINLDQFLSIYDTKSSETFGLSVIIV